MKIELKALKKSQGDECPQFEAKLYVDGKIAAIVSNPGRGGAHRFNTFIKDEKTSREATERLKRFYQFCKRCLGKARTTWNCVPRLVRKSKPISRSAREKK